MRQRKSQSKDTESFKHKWLRKCNENQTFTNETEEFAVSTERLFFSFSWDGCSFFLKRPTIHLELLEAGAEVSKRSKLRLHLSYAYTMCARQPASAMPKPKYLYGRSFWWCMVVFPRCVRGGDVKTPLMCCGELYTDL